jgi:hypothetical protein
MTATLVYSTTTPRANARDTNAVSPECEPDDPRPMPMVDAFSVRVTAPWHSHTHTQASPITYRYDHSRLAARLRAAVASSKVARHG